MLAISASLRGRGKTLIFTSGSAVFGVFSNGQRAEPAFAEDTKLPLPRSVFAPLSIQATEIFATELADAVGARIEAEQAVLGVSGVRGMVVRPGNIYGYGGSVDIPRYIEIARKFGVAPYWAKGARSRAMFISGTSSSFIGWPLPAAKAAASITPPR